MIKPDSLRAALTAGMIDDAGARFLERDPGKLNIFIDKGRIAGRLEGNVGFEWRYRLQVILTDFPPDRVDALALIVMMWIADQQPELLANHQSGNEAVKFDADILGNGAIDLALELELSEAVDARPREGGGYDLVHRPEPIAWPDFDDVPAGTRLEKFYLGDSLIFDGSAG